MQISANVANKLNVTDELYQWDTNQTLEISGIPETGTLFAHFENRSMGVALVVATTTSGTNLVATVPNVALQYPDALYLHIASAVDDTKSSVVASFKIPIVARARPSDYVYVANVEIYRAQALLEALDAVPGTIESVESAVQDGQACVSNLEGANATAQSHIETLESDITQATEAQDVLEGILEEVQAGTAEIYGLEPIPDAEILEICVL